VAAVLLVVAVAITASVADAGATNAVRPATRAHAAAGQLKIIYITPDPATEEVGARIHNGFMAAGAQLGIDTVFRSTATYSTDPNQEKALIQDAIAEKPSGLVIADTVPTALNATIKQAVNAGIPVVLANTGLGETQATGALTYVGNNEIASGKLGGQLLKQAGGTHAAMLTLPSGIQLTDQRLAGFQKGFGGPVTAVRVPVSDSVSQMEAALVATLQKDPSINAVFSAGSLLTPPMLAAEAELGAAGRKVKWGAIDVYPQDLQSIKAHKLLFALDQQPYLEGYLPVLFLKQYLKLGLRPVQPLVPTGPVVVNSSNVDQIIGLSNEKLR
jgi:simple sugar transport system substrate-binding protein